MLLSTSRNHLHRNESPHELLGSEDFLQIQSRRLRHRDVEARKIGTDGVGGFAQQFGELKCGRDP